ELRAGEQEKRGGVKEGDDQIKNRMNRVARGDDHEGRRNADEGEQIEEYRLESCQHRFPQCFSQPTLLRRLVCAAAARRPAIWLVCLDERPALVHSCNPTSQLQRYGASSA